MRVALLVPIGFALGAAACTIALRGAPASISVDLAQPIAVVTYWQNFGALMWLMLFGAVVVASVGYVCVILSSSKDGDPAGSPFGKLRMTAVLSALACACALAFPVIFSSDVYAYAGYGDMALHGIDTYAHARVTVRDPLLDAMVWQWGNPPPICVYGPAFLFLAKGLVALFLPLGIEAPLWAFRVLSCASLVACAPLAYAAFRSFSPSRRLLAAAGISLNPIAIWSCAEGHNDAIMLAIVLAGFALTARSRAFTGSMTIVLAALVKMPALAAAGTFVAYSWKNTASRPRVLLGTLLGLLIVIALAGALERGVFAHLAPGGHYFPQFSLQYALARILPVPIAVTLVLLGCAAIGLLGLRELYYGSAGGAIFIALAVWFALPNSYPWYALWILPVAFLAKNEESRAMWAVIAATLCIVFRYYGDATTDLSPALNIAIVALQFTAPIALLMDERRYRVHPDRRGIRRPVPGFAHSRNS